MCAERPGGGPDGGPGRRVTIALLDLAGRPLGALPPFDVDTPYWQDVVPVTARVPGTAVLRLVAARPAPGQLMGGEVTYLAQVLDGGGFAAAAGGLGPFPPIALDDDPLRLPWARPGGPAADLAWASAVTPLARPPVQHRTWNLSAIWELDTSEGRRWLKCVPPFLAHEPAVLRRLAGGPVPVLVAADGHRQLLEPLAGTDGYDASPTEHRALIEALVDLQLTTTGQLDDLVADGVPDDRLGLLGPRLARLVERLCPHDRVLGGLADSLDERRAAIEACGLPDVLVHGDAHPGNARIGTAPVWFDWGDSAVGHPLLDLAVERRRPDTIAAAATIDHWLACWASAVPGSKPRRAFELLEPLAALRSAATYQGFLDHIEASERPYHAGDVAPMLDLARRLAADSSP